MQVEMECRQKNKYSVISYFVVMVSCLAVQFDSLVFNLGKKKNCQNGH